jgi:predicted nucleic-acid-binding Zn-ribbon protein
MQIIFGEDQHIPEAGTCPVCGNRLTGALPATNNRGEEKWSPTPGDYSVCVYCGTTLRFEMNLQYRVATRDDLKELLDVQPDTFAVIEKIIAVAHLAIEDRRKERRDKRRWH